MHIEDCLSCARQRNERRSEYTREFSRHQTTLPVDFQETKKKEKKKKQNFIQIKRKGRVSPSIHQYTLKLLDQSERC